MVWWCGWVKDDDHDDDIMLALADIGDENGGR